MSAEMNPMGREYSDAEWAAAKRVGLRGPSDTDGPLIWACGGYWPDHARDEARAALKRAADWELLADAMDREWVKEVRA